MPEYEIVVFSGDHCGPEVTKEAIKILDVIQNSKPDIKFKFHNHLLGGCSIDAHGTPLTDEALRAAKAAHAVIIGAVGGPEWGTGSIRPEQGILELRKQMGTFGNLRPCNFASASLVDISPLKAEVCSGVDMIILRELTGGIYFGERQEPQPGKDYASDLEYYTRSEIERIIRLAAHLAMQKNPPAKITSLDKANVLATGRLWRQVTDEVLSKEFPQLRYEHQLIDSAAMLLVKNPTKMNGIVVTSNMFGDIITDEASVIPGSLGLLPSASLAGIPDNKTLLRGIYEPIHGSAPDISGKGLANPVAAILSMAMLLSYSLCLPVEAAAVEEAVRRTIDEGIRTKDIGGTASTSEVGDATARHLRNLLSR